MTIDPNAPVRAEHRITIHASVDTVWSLLIRVVAWPSWNPAVTLVRVDEPLKPGVTFRWKSGGASIVSTVQKMEAPRFIGWTGKALGTRAVHLWRLDSTPAGVIVTTEESFDGWLVRLLKGTMQKALDAALLDTLAKLKAAAERA